jgi:hypothetical protein
VINEEEIIVVCPVPDWSIFIAIGVCRVLSKRGCKVSIMPRSISQENILASDVGIKTCDGSNIIGTMLFLAPDPIAERDARNRGIGMRGCVVDEVDERWINVSGCWNGQCTESVISAYCSIFGDDMDMSVLSRMRGIKPYAGVAIKDESVRMFIKSAFFVENSRLWHVPVRQNAIKRIQESASCATLITDDPFCAMASFAHGNSAIILRKPCDGLPCMERGDRLVEQHISEEND